jgi:hypothetical protein
LKEILPNSSAKKEFEVVIRRKKDTISCILTERKLIEGVEKWGKRK